MSQSFLKAALNGPNASGKSGTAVRLAVGISKELCGSAPVIAFDAEERYRFYKRNIFDVERVPLIIIAGKSLVKLQQALSLVEHEGGCVFIGDQLTTPWKEGVSAFSSETGSLSFDRRQQLMNQWEPIVQNFRYGKFHAICLGRVGYWWQNVEDEATGAIELIQGDTKFNAGGGENFGYEADLELEVRRKKRNLLGLLRGKTKVEHILDIIKDATDSGILTGKQFVYSAKEGPYQPGDYKPVLDSFRDYLAYLGSVNPPTPNTSSTRVLLKGGKTDWARDQADRKGLLEELDNLLNQCFPGGEKRSKLDNMCRHLTLEYLNGYSSWSRMEEECKTINLERNVLIAKRLRGRIQSGERVTDQASLAAILHLSAEDVLHPGHGLTLLEVMAARTNGKGPQPVVAAIDKEATDEFAV